MSFVTDICEKTKLAANKFAGADTATKNARKRTTYSRLTRWTSKRRKRVAETPLSSTD